MNASAAASAFAARCRWVALIAGLTFGAAVGQAARPVWRCGWFPQPPLQYESHHGDVAVLAGLDMKIFQAIAHEAGRHVELAEKDRSQQEAQIRSGRSDVAFGVTRTPEREAFARFSEPYRREEQVIYVRAADLARFPSDNVASFLAAIKARRLRLGVVKGEAYASPEIRAFVADPANVPFLFPGHTEAENLARLADGDLDAALCERLVGATLSTQLDYEARLVEHPLRFGTVDVYAMFSRASTTEADVADFNRALHAVQTSGEYDLILRDYVLPTMLDIAVGGRWFFWLDVIGTAAFALSGVILAHQGRYNIIGAFVLAALPAVGGGVLRDLIAGRYPVAVMRSPVQLLVVGGVVLGGCLVFKLLDRAPVEAVAHRARIGVVFDALCAFFDTVGLAVFTISGVRVAVVMHCEPLWIWGTLFAILTGAGGGILRDIVRADMHNATLKRGFYAEVGLVWGLAFSLFLEWQVRRLGETEILQGLLVVLFGAFVTRLVIQYRGWSNPFQLGNRHTLPERRLALLSTRARALAAEFPAWFEERAGVTRPRSLVEIEKLHGAALRELAVLRAIERELMAESLTPALMRRAVLFLREIDSLAAVEETLYALASEPSFVAESAQRLQEAIYASVVTLGLCAAESVQSAEDHAAFLALTHDRGRTIEAVRDRFAATTDVIAAAERSRVLQFTVRFERLVELLHDSGRSGRFLSPT